MADKLDEILAAAQQTISTNEAPGPRVQGVKRERGRGFYNVVCLCVRRLKQLLQMAKIIILMRWNLLDDTQDFLSYIFCRKCL